MAEFRLGKQPAMPRRTDFRFADFASTVKLPTAPSKFGHGNAYADWHMLGNDHFGDCVWAGAAHERAVRLLQVVQRRDRRLRDHQEV